MYRIAALLLCATVKILGALEWPPLYRFFLSIPAKLLSFFLVAECDEFKGVYTFPTFILDHSCSGIHFFMVVILLLVWRETKTLRGFLKALTLAYLLTLTANTARVALFLKVAHFSGGRPWLHEAVGTAVFISTLFFYYLATDLRRKHATEK